MKLCSSIQNYIDIVEQEKVRVCKEQKLLIKFVKRIFETEDIYVDEKLLANYLSLQKYFDFKLFEWEEFIFTLHNCAFRADGMPRFPDLFVFVGRGAGKNGYLSFEDFCLISHYNTIKYYHIDICATNEEQAKTSFDDIYNVLENPEHTKKLKKFFKWNKEEIVCLKTKSKIKYRTNNAKGKDGLRSGKVDFDEVHQYKTYENIKVFTTGLGKKAHPRKTYITTNGDEREGVLDDLIEKSMLILKGEADDNGFLPFICRLNDKEQVHDAKNWVMANPSLLYLPNLQEEIKKEYIEYCENRSSASDFMTKRMNLPDGNLENELTTWDNIKATNQEIPDMQGNAAVVGIDYTKINDFAAAGLLFKKDGKFIWIHHTWVCKHSKDLHRIKFPLKEAEEQGELTFVDALNISPDLIAEWIQEQMSKHHINKLALDDFRYPLLKKALEQIGFEHIKGAKIEEQPIKLVRPSDKLKVEAIIDTAFIEHNIVYGDSKLMRWYANNTKKVKEKNGNYSYQKIEAKSRKNDGFMAFVHAMTIADELPEYEQMFDLETIAW